MRVITFTDKQYEDLRNEILKDQAAKLEFAAQGMRHGDVVNSVGWRGTLITSFLYGAVHVPSNPPKVSDPILKREFIRYGHDQKGRRKNVLVTFRDESKGLIYFGVSRCDLSCDKFDREEGIRLARARAEYAQKNSGYSYYWSGDLFGAAKAECIKELLDWFDEIC